MKTMVTLDFKPDENKSSTAKTRHFQSIWRIPPLAGVLLWLVVLGAPHARAQAVSIWNDATVPSLAAANDPSATEVGLKFRSGVSGYITGIRFYKGPGNTGTHVGHLWTSAGGLLGSATFGAETASGWQLQSLPSPVPINANTTYLVSYHAPAGNYAADVLYFAASGVDNSPLRALANGEDGPNGVYAYGASGTFPNQTFNAANYWVDVVFEETLGSDNTAPTVSSVSPAAGANGVSSGTAVTVTFSEAMDASTINNNTYILRDASANPVAATVSYIAASFGAVLTPTSPLNVPQTYTVTLVGGAAGAKDVAGNPLDSTFTSSFTTGEQAAFSIWDDSTTPGTPSAADSNAIEVGLKFRSATSGSVTGIRFYKGPSNTGPHVGNLWTASGTLLATVTFANETAAGWQTQGLPSAVPIDSNTTYIVSYHAPAGGYAADADYFAASGVDSDPLRALANGEDGPNGVYAYNPSSIFPNQTFRAANYWVDVVVTVPNDSDCAGDIIPPTIIVPHDVILGCADCNTDPSNTGMATAADSCSVTVTYSDRVTGVCPKVVTRTWIATDGAGNTANSMQTITCLPPSLVTDSSGCIFDRDPTTPVQDFRLIFIQDPQNWPCYRIVASNPGQFFYNVFFTGNPGEQVTFNLSLPYPFVTQGANPIHAYDGVTVVSRGGQPCLVPGAEFFVSPQQVNLAAYGNQPRPLTTVPVTLTVPASGVVYLAVHLDYGLKKYSGFTKNVYDDAVDCATGKVLIPNQGSYEFGVSGAQNGSASVQNYNAFKRIPGVAGLVLQQGTSSPVQGAVVKLANAKNVPVGSGVTDEDGFYMIAYKHTGKVATYYVSIATPPPVSYAETKPTKLKANQFVRLDFWVP